MLNWKLKSTLTRLLVFFCIVFVVSCSSPRHLLRSSVESRYCEPSLIYTYHSQYLPKGEIESMLSKDSSLTNRFSKHDLLVANAIGVLPLLQDLIRLQQQKGRDSRLEQAVLHRKINSRLLLASTEISSIVAELDCEGERASQLAFYLDQRDQQRIRNLTVISIVAGAATAVVAAFMANSNVENAISIGGGIVSAGLGTAAAFTSNQTVPFAHKRNLLSDIWGGSEESTIYSPFIWYVLNEKFFSNSGETSIRHNIRQRWKDYLLTEATDEEQVLYFSAGGDYDSDDLHARSNMLNELQASILTINQNLRSLIANLPD
ncbi:hypothetical protein [Telluribacter sp. SYSU D00476]|uniref:hypothetical protein n=1 Tax=Telluribacter sp. SYSU D00476 TaxID=2811430 RepID=UPI001FF58A3E|nr:hypothetical protein [Telluribacter sp. SYSU D00476]